MSVGSHGLGPCWPGVDVSAAEGRGYASSQQLLLTLGLHGQQRHSEYMWDPRPQVQGPPWHVWWPGLLTWCGACRASGPGRALGPTRCGPGTSLRRVCPDLSVPGLPVLGLWPTLHAHGPRCCVFRSFLLFTFFLSDQRHPRFYDFKDPGIRLGPLG